MGKEGVIEIDLIKYKKLYKFINDIIVEKVWNQYSEIRISDIPYIKREIEEKIGELLFEDRQIENEDLEKEVVDVLNEIDDKLEKETGLKFSEFEYLGGGTVHYYEDGGEGLVDVDLYVDDPQKVNRIYLSYLVIEENRDLR